MRRMEDTRTRAKMARAGTLLGTALIVVALLLPTAAQATLVSRAVNVAIDQGACKVLHKLVRRDGLEQTRRGFISSYEAQGYSHEFSARFFRLLRSRCG